MRCPLWRWFFRLSKVTCVQEVLTLLARLCGDLRFASRSSCFWSQAPPIPSELSVDEHAELLAKAARVAWRRAAPRVRAAPQADWMDTEAWQVVRAHAVARRAPQKGSRFLSRAWLKKFFEQWRQAVRPDSEQRRQELLWDVEGLANLNLQIAWCRHDMDAQAGVAREAARKAKQRRIAGSDRFHGALAGNGRLGGDVVGGA